MENHQATRKITLWMLLPIALIYGIRLLIQHQIDSIRGSFGSGWLIIWLCGWTWGLLWIVFTLLLAAFGLRRDRLRTPMIVLLSGSILALITPLPSLAPPIFPEQDFFAAHQVEFEQVVALAQQDKLNCLLGEDCTSMGRWLPSEYQRFFQFDVVQVGHDPDAGLTVTFQPLDSHFPIIYFEKIDSNNRLLSSICAPQRDGVRILDEHWYLCVEEWDIG